jgi:FPC/CPF motif-containing protein YcgG
LFPSTSPSPLLGRYGEEEGREYKQYFLYDDNQTPPVCPFARLAQTKTSPIEDTEQAA